MRGNERIHFLSWIITIYSPEDSAKGSAIMGPFIGVGFALAILLNPMNAIMGFGFWLAIMYYIYKRQQTSA
jgi:hypothetical protein